MGTDEVNDMARQGGIFVSPDEGRTLWVADELMTFTASATDTGRAYALTDSLVPPQGGPPPHMHLREDEAFWLLEGERDVMVGEGRFMAASLPDGHNFRLPL